MGAGGDSADALGMFAVLGTTSPMTPPTAETVRAVADGDDVHVHADLAERICLKLTPTEAQLLGRALLTASADAYDLMARAARSAG